MKDLLKTCERELGDDAVYKDVVVIGNGPSGLVTSFLLAGNAPRLRAVPADAPLDDMLRARLSWLPPGQDLLEAELGALAAGLEGRSHNPVPLLMDSLLQPGADLGMFSPPLVDWTHDERRRVEHVVLGRSAPGGAWHGFPRRVRSLSPAAWLTLPGAAAALPGGPGGDPRARVLAPEYASYCRRYVQVCRLQRYFRSGVVVTSVRAERRRGHRFRVSGYVVASGEPVQYVCRRVVLAAGAGDRPAAPLPALAAVAEPPATDVSAGSGPLLVVGSGVSAADAVLAARGAGRRVYHVHRRAAGALAALDARVYPDYHQVYKMMCDGAAGCHDNYTSLPDHVVLHVAPVDAPPDALPGDSPTGRCNRVTLFDPVARAVIEVTVTDIAVLTGTRPDLYFLQTNLSAPPPAPPPASPPPSSPPSSHPRAPLARCFLSSPWQQLKAALGHTVQACKARYVRAADLNGNDAAKCGVRGCGDATKCGVRDCGNGTKCGVRGCADAEPCACTCACDSDPCSCVCEQINLLSDGIGFGVDPTRPVDGRSNPLAIDKTTHELLHAPAGIYAVGPVAGDNFVRFIPGGALAAVAHIHKQIKMEAD